MKVLKQVKKGVKKEGHVKKALSFILIKSNLINLSQEWVNHKLLKKKSRFSREQSIESLQKFWHVENSKCNLKSETSWSEFELNFHTYLHCLHERYNVTV